MKKPKLLLLDANVVIQLFEQGLWDKVVTLADVVLARTVVGEAKHFDCGSECRPIDLTADIQANRISTVEVAVSDLKHFCDQFDPVYMEKMDAGEAESLAWLISGNHEGCICSADRIVFRVLGHMDRQDQGISLEEVLQSMGQNCKVPWQFTKAFRQEWTGKGWREKMLGIGLKKPDGS
jgi:hypothetical protein